MKRFEVEVASAAFKESTPPLKEELVAKTLKHTIMDEKMIDILRLCGKYVYNTLFALENNKLENIEEDLKKQLPIKLFSKDVWKRGTRKSVLNQIFKNTKKGWKSFRVPSYTSTLG